MQELLSKTKFINALARKHVHIDKLHQEAWRDRSQGYLDLKLEWCAGDIYRIRISGDHLPGGWTMLDVAYPCTTEGMRAAHKAAVDIALRAAEKASAQTNASVSFGMPSVQIFGIG